jgi:uncharacterized protein
MSRPTRILIFTRYPVPGKVKTRIIPALGATGAARLHRRMTQHIVANARGLAKDGAIRVCVCFTGAPAKKVRAWLGDDLLYVPQLGADLGARQNAAFCEAFRAGSESVLAVGSDIPGLTRDILGHALETLGSSDVVIGPALDGGYYLIGMQRAHPELFANIDWGGSHVFEQTRAAAERLGLKLAVLPMLSDVDRPEDLAELRSNPQLEDVFTGKPRISVIIPCLNEAHTLGRTLDRIKQAGDLGKTLEIIVADGGSQDGTRAVAAKNQALVLHKSGGRSAQQNAGAATAQGPLLLFLHADTLLPESFAQMIRMTLDDPEVIAGAFRFQTDSPLTAMRLIEWAANARSKMLQCPYGDQGLFMEQRVFREMGGFAPQPILEDYELVRRLRRRGKIVTLPQPARTSARRWERLGILRTFAINQIMIAGYLCGVPPHRLARLYRGRNSG